MKGIWLLQRLDKAKVRKWLLLCVFSFGSVYSSVAWDRTRHDAIASIAEQHLTRRAKRNIARYLEHSIVYYASYMDKHRNAQGFRDIEHVSYVDGQMQLVAPPLRDGKVNCVVALMQACDRLRNYREMDDSLVRLNLMYVIHIAGDMHCPSHVKYPGCKSGRAVLNGKKMSYHAVWGWGVLDRAHGWSYSEYREQLDPHTKRERRAIAAGTPREWVHETAVDCLVIYDWQQPDEVYDNTFVQDTYLLAERQLVRAAYRLATLLNKIFE